MFNDLQMQLLAHDYSVTLQVLRSSAVSKYVDVTMKMLAEILANSNQNGVDTNEIEQSPTNIAMKTH